MFTVPWMGFRPGDAVERGETFELKMLKLGKAVKATITPEPVEKAVTRPKEKRDGRNI